MTITEFEANRTIKSKLGQKFSAVRINGYWVIGHSDLTTDHSYGRVSPNPLRKSLELAIKDVKSALTK